MNPFKRKSTMGKKIQHRKKSYLEKLAKAEFNHGKNFIKEEIITMQLY
jgi:hypothetical protein